MKAAFSSLTKPKVRYSCPPFINFIDAKERSFM